VKTAGTLSATARRCGSRRTAWEPKSND
jgi:hypothetical protein